MDDEELVQRVAEGNSDAFDELFHRHHPAVLNWLRGGLPFRLHDRADDLAQEVWLRVHQRAETLARDHKAGAFRRQLKSVAQQVALEPDRYTENLDRHNWRMCLIRVIEKACRVSQRRANRIINEAPCSLGCRFIREEAERYLCALDQLNVSGELVAVIGQEGVFDIRLACLPTQVPYSLWEDDSAESAGLPMMEGREGREGELAYTENLDQFAQSVRRAVSPQDWYIWRLRNDGEPDDEVPEPLPPREIATRLAMDEREVENAVRRVRRAAEQVAHAMNLRLIRRGDSLPPRAKIVKVWGENLLIREGVE